MVGDRRNRSVRGERGTNFQLQNKSQDEKYSKVNRVSNTVITLYCMVTDGDYTDPGEHCTMYIIAEFLCGTPETNVPFCINSTSIFKEFLF